MGFSWPQNDLKIKVLFVIHSWARWGYHPAFDTPWLWPTLDDFREMWDIRVDTVDHRIATLAMICPDAPGWWAVSIWILGESSCCISLWCRIPGIRCSYWLCDHAAGSFITLPLTLSAETHTPQNIFGYPHTLPLFSVVTTISKLFLACITSFAFLFPHSSQRSATYCTFPFSPFYFDFSLEYIDISNPTHILWWSWKIVFQKCFFVWVGSCALFTLWVSSEIS